MLLFVVKNRRVLLLLLISSGLKAATPGEAGPTLLEKLRKSDENTTVSITQDRMPLNPSRTQTGTLLSYGYYSTWGAIPTEDTQEPEAA